MPSMEAKIPSASKISRAARRIASRLRRASARSGRGAGVAVDTYSVLSPHCISGDSPHIMKLGTYPTYLTTLTAGVTMAERLDGRTVLVTGANGGLGQDSVQQALD